MMHTLFTIDDFINSTENKLKQAFSHLDGLDGLPGIYTSKDDFDQAYRTIDYYEQLVECLKEYKELKKEKDPIYNIGHFT